MRVLITGGSGFLGSALVRHLAEAGHEVAVVLRSSSSAARLENVTGGLRLHRIDAPQELFGLFAAQRPDVVLHTACSYGRQGEPLHQLAAANISFGLAALQAAAECGALGFLNTDTALDRLTSPYSLSKKQFAEWGRWLGHQQKLRFINVELQHMYGAGDDKSKFTSHVLHACHNNLPSLALTPGQQRRDFVYIKDVVSAYACLVEKMTDLAWVADVGLGSGQAPTVEEFVRLVHRLTASSTHLDFGAIPYRPGESMHCVADVAFLRSLGWSPQYTLEEGIEETLSLEFPR